MSGPQPPPSADSITALAFSIFGWTVLPVFGWVFAYIYAGRARRLAQQHPDRYSGVNLADAATTISFIGMWVVFLVIVVTGVIIGVLVARDR